MVPHEPNHLENALESAATKLARERPAIRASVVIIGVQSNDPPNAER
jgi:hypothetical protein